MVADNDDGTPDDLTITITLPEGFPDPSLEGDPDVSDLLLFPIQVSGKSSAVVLGEPALAEAR